MRMRKYIKPELEFVSFKIKADVMVNTTTIPEATVGAYAASDVSDGNVYIQDYTNQAWTSVDGENWDWAN